MPSHKIWVRSLSGINYILYLIEVNTWNVQGSNRLKFWNVTVMKASILDDPL